MLLFRPQEVVVMIRYLKFAGGHVACPCAVKDFRHRLFHVVNYVTYPAAGLPGKNPLIDGTIAVIAV